MLTLYFTRVIQLLVEQIHLWYSKYLGSWDKEPIMSASILLEALTMQLGCDI